MKNKSVFLGAGLILFSLFIFSNVLAADNCAGLDNGDSCTLTNPVNGSNIGKCSSGLCFPVTSAAMVVTTGCSNDSDCDDGYSCVGDFSSTESQCVKSEGCCVVSQGNCLGTTGTSCSVGVYAAGACSGNSLCKAGPAATGGCCVVSPGNCLGTTGTSCTHGEYVQKTCTEVDTCNAGSTDSTDPTIQMGGIYIPTNTGLASTSIKAILENLLRWLLGIVGIIALIGFVISGIQYVISTGDDTKMETAKNNMMYSIMGVVVALAGYVIIQAVDFALRARSF